jgi:hypothetical protein
MRSTLLAELKDNTTSHLIRDIEALREHLAVDRWLIAGGQPLLAVRHHDGGVSGKVAGRSPPA